MGFAGAVAGSAARLRFGVRAKALEGMTNCAIRVYALSDTENIDVKNLNIDAGTGWTGPPRSVTWFGEGSNAAPTLLGKAVTIGNEVHPKLTSGNAEKTVRIGCESRFLHTPSEQS